MTLGLTLGIVAVSSLAISVLAGGVLMATGNKTGALFLARFSAVAILAAIGTVLLEASEVV